MAGAMITVDYASVLDTAVGAAHGLSLAEIERAAASVGAVVERIERERSDGKHRYRDLPADTVMLKTVQAAIRKHAKAKFENLVVLGIGGSALGNTALQTALNPCYHNLLPATRRRGPRLFVMDNVDPTQIAGLLDLLGPALRKTLFNVISKSGETAETAAQFLIFRDLLAKKLGKNYARNLLVTTDPEGGTMRSIVDAAGYDSLPVPPGVGGRFSVFSAVGLFSAGMCGIRIDKLLAGAAAMGTRVADANVRQNPAAMLALLLHAFYVRGKRLHVMMPYSYQLTDLADWYRQMWAESLGKADDLDGNRVNLGPTPIKALGATDQHSQVQLYREGPNDKVFIFLEVQKFGRDVKIPRVKGLPEELAYLQGKSLSVLLNAEKAATEYALVQSERPCLTIRFPVVREETVGQFIMLWEAATTITGGLLNINPYDQPAVQMGKDFTYALMGKKGYDAQAQRYHEYAAKRGRAVV